MQLKLRKWVHMLFASKETKKVPRTIRNYVGAENIVRSLSFLK